MSANTVPEEHRPKTVVIVAAFLFGATILAFITGESLLFPNALLDYMWRLNPEGAALGAGTFFAALGLLRGRPWAWWFAVFLFAIDACGNMMSYAFVHDALRSISGTIISGTFLFFLCRHSVRSYFLRQALTPNHKP
jgi:hypothetical protein